MTTPGVPLNELTARWCLRRLGVTPEDDPAEFDRLYRSLEQHWQSGGSVKQWLSDQRALRAPVTSSGALRCMARIYK